MLTLLGGALPAPADPVDDAKASLCSVLGQAGVSGVLDCDSDGDGFTPGEGDCNDNDRAVNPAVEDEPDTALIDANCDGLDGDPSRAIFVTPQGHDSFPGTREQPKRTVRAAVGAAQAQQKDVYVAAGDYDEGEGVLAATGVGIYGGYVAGGTWSRSTSSVSRIVGRPQAVLADGVTGVVLQSLALRAETGGSAGSSNAYGVRALSSSLRLERVVVEAFAAQGRSSGAVAVGSPAASGSNGAPGSCDGDPVSNGGPGGSSPIGRSGGAGGSGHESVNGGSGATGAGPGGGTGGQGGSAGDPGGPGMDGQPGANGAQGAHGAGGSSVPLTITDHWVGMPGARGADGADGSGGGGGGAGGGQTGFFVNDGAGNGGGGGGAGGAGGAGGYGGPAGGGSFGLFLRGSTVEVTDGTTIAAGPGGPGHEGRMGNPGQEGGAGGLGASHCISEVGRGGNGGAGGDGGNGGAGGGGAGGPSIGAYVDATSSLTFSDAPEPTHGPGGEGGPSYGGAAYEGAQGIAAAIYP